MKPWQFSLILVFLSIPFIYINISLGPIPLSIAILTLVINLYSFLRDVRFFSRPTFLQLSTVGGLFKITPCLAVSYNECSCFGVHLEWGNLHIGIVSLCPVKPQDQKASPDAPSNQ